MLRNKLFCFTAFIFSEMSETKSKSKSRSKKIAKDFLIYSIGVIGSKLMTFLLLPLYTHYISNPEDYGYYDMCLTACFVLMPIVSLQLRDGAFRFLLDAKDIGDKSKIVTFVNKSLIVTSLTTIILAIGIYFLSPFPYLWYTLALLVIMSFYEVYAQTIRGVGNNRSFILVGLSASFWIGVLSIVFVVMMDMGVPGIFLANILARVLAVCGVELKERMLIKYFRFSGIDCSGIGRDVLKFSMPLIPTAICWWFVGFSNRYFIKEFISMHESGIYGVASRLATVVMTIAAIFAQTWQENAIQQYSSPDRNEFFSKVFNGYIFSFIGVTVLYVFGAKAIFPYLFSANYSESMKYLYPLCVSTMLFALSSYFEIIYHCEKRTSRLLPPVLAAPIINVVLNFLLIKPLGINGVIISYAITYIAIIAYRWIDVMKYVKIKFFKITFIPIIITIVGTIPFVMDTTILFDVCFVILSIASLFISKEFRDNVTKRYRGIIARVKH